MKATKAQAGSHIIGVAVAILVVGLVGFTGYKVWDNNKSDKTEDQTSQSVPEIKNTDDLTAASQTVDELDTSTADLDSLEKDLDAL